MRRRLALAAGAGPLLALGLVASALADRLAFAGWALAAAFGYAALLARGWARGWETRRQRGVALAWVAGAMALFGALVVRHGEALDLGYRAVLWEVYHPLPTRPAASFALAGALAVGGAYDLLKGAPR